MLSKKEVGIVIGIVVLIVGFYFFMNNYLVMSFDGVEIERATYNSMNKQFNGNFMVCDIDTDYKTELVDCLYFIDGEYQGKRKQ